MTRICIQWLLILLALATGSGSAFSSEISPSLSASAADEALQLGERMYREGILPSGKPMKATVMGDIPVDGRMFTCDDCHQRSGLGSLEGTVITWPTNGKELYQPRRRTGAYRPPAGKGKERGGRGSLPEYYQMEDVRPAYTDASLARLLRSGRDPAGRKLDPIMPRFRLGREDMGILIHYLKNLSVDFAPGVDETSLSFATVIGPQVPQGEREAMLSVLQAHIDAHNSQSRHQERRAVSGPFYKTERHKSYRRLKLSIWELKGPEDSWREQLESYYLQEPVFALLGGISSGSWQEIHGFSEDHRLPCLFPITDLPVISATDWYTLYFSKGVYQEGESAAKYLRTAMGGKKGSSVVQVYRKGSKGAALAEGFRRAWEGMGREAPKELVLGEESGAGGEQALVREGLANASTLLLWLDRDDGDVFSRLAGRSAPDTLLFASATLLQNNFSAIADALRDRLYITYPASLPDETDKRGFAVRRWLQARDIPQTNFSIQARMYFLGWMLPGALKSMRSEFYREYFIEGFDMMTDQDYAIAVYPRLTFGPGQRYASKGCYIVKLAEGPDPALLTVSDWVTY